MNLLAPLNLAGGKGSRIRCVYRVAFPGELYYLLYNEDDVLLG